jgi:hypothetical protein
VPKCQKVGCVATEIGRMRDFNSFEGFFLVNWHFNAVIAS